MSTKKRSAAVTATTSKSTPAPEPKSTKSSTVTLVANVQAGISLIAFAFAVAAIERDLSPIFGGVATNLYLKNVVSILPVALLFLPRLRLRSVPNALILSNCICLAPFVYFQLGISAARSKRIILGPAMAYTPVLIPLAYFSTDLIRQFIILLIPKAADSRGLKSVIGVATASVVLSQQAVINSFSYGRYINPTSLLVFTGYCLAATVAIPAFSQSRAPSSKLRKTGNSLIYILLVPPLLSLLSVYPSTLPFTHRSGLLRVLSSTPSITGRIVVGDEFKHGFRFLRADHSILGGVWVGDKAVKQDKGAPVPTAKDGTKLGDSIYSAFVLQEAARLHERDRPQKNALNIRPLSKSIRRSLLRQPSSLA
ncbi:hypothetical protein SCHPADRAFT_157856 [Schizopora paradoxa]|uniref:Uncharacterized protein n=1 Tax=Schizopora paradoxa TaxID=27342 RepID=A0A0H2SKT4_9AGAM|nr:hypothetical protein SCHPADRAFT_157856 [Schizopora paradoxa]